MDLILSTVSSRVVQGVGGITSLLVLLYTLLPDDDDPNNKQGGKGRRLGKFPLGSEPPGLANLGNTCFFNSILQSLAALPSFVRYLDHFPSNHPDRRCFKIIGALRGTLYDLNQPKLSSAALSPYSLLNSIGSKLESNIGRQQDAHEALQILTKYIEKGKNINLEDFRSILSEKTQSMLVDANSEQACNPFYGILATMLTCTRCKVRSKIRYQSFTNISLDLPEMKGISHLEECFKKFTSLETITGVECASCSINSTLEVINSVLFDIEHRNSSFSYDIHCQLGSLRRQQAWLKRKLKRATVETEELTEELENMSNQVDRKYYVSIVKVKSTMKKQTFLARLPKILCLHINRLKFDVFGNSFKDPTVLSYPALLKIDGFMTNGSTKANYSLRSAVKHIGPAQGGHFVAYRRVDCIVSNSMQGTDDEDDGEYKEDLSDSHISFSDSEAFTSRSKRGDHSRKFRKVHIVDRFQNEQELKLQFRSQEGSYHSHNTVPKWFMMSDEQCFSIPEREVLQMDAYMLFYERL